MQPKLSGRTAINAVAGAFTSSLLALALKMAWKQNQRRRPDHLPALDQMDWRFALRLGQQIGATPEVAAELRLATLMRRQLEDLRQQAAKGIISPGQVTAVLKLLEQTEAGKVSQLPRLCTASPPA